MQQFILFKKLLKIFLQNQQNKTNKYYYLFYKEQLLINLM